MLINVNLLNKIIFSRENINHTVALQKNAEELMRQRLLVKHNVNPDKAKHEEKVAPHSSGNEVLEKEVASLKKNVSV